MINFSQYFLLLRSLKIVLDKFNVCNTRYRNKWIVRHISLLFNKRIHYFHTADVGMLLKLDFRDEFKLEDSPECRFDSLEVRDGKHGYSNLLGKFCGSNFPPEITSKTRYLWLRFHSDENIEGKGFKAVWSMIPRPTYRKSILVESTSLSTSSTEPFKFRRNIHNSFYDYHLRSPYVDITKIYLILHKCIYLYM